MSKTRVKVIINDGIVTGVLSDGDVDVEIIDIDKDYGDYESIREYEDEVYSDRSLKETDYTVAHFDEGNGQGDEGA